MEWLGYVAGCGTVASFVPQLVRAFKTRKTRDLSLGTLALLIGSGALWLIYGAVNGDLPLIITNASMTSLVFTLLLAKLRFDRAA